METSSNPSPILTLRAAPVSGLRFLPEMKRHMKLLKNVAILFSLSAATALAQPGPGGPNGFGGPPGHGRPFLPPIMRVLDSNTNGVLEAAEIAAAPTALLTLDANKDGKLSADELMGQRPEGGNAQRPGPQPGGKRPSPAVIKTMDANDDGELDAAEIANAPVSLLKLDINQDGQLTQAELRPPRPEGGPGRDGAGQPPPPQ